MLAFVGRRRRRQQQLRIFPPNLRQFPLYIRASVSPSGSFSSFRAVHPRQLASLIRVDSFALTRSAERTERSRRARFPEQRSELQLLRVRMLKINKPSRVVRRDPLLLRELLVQGQVPNLYSDDDVVSDQPRERASERAIGRPAGQAIGSTVTRSLALSEQTHRRNRALTEVTDIPSRNGIESKRLKRKKIRCHVIAIISCCVLAPSSSTAVFQSDKRCRVVGPTAVPPRRSVGKSTPLACLSTAYIDDCGLHVRDICSPY